MASVGRVRDGGQPLPRTAQQCLKGRNEKAGEGLRGTERSDAWYKSVLRVMQYIEIAKLLNLSTERISQ
eukprot:3934224-Rhodomonas_salina.4